MGKFSVESSIWINSKKRPFIGKGRIELLKHIHKTGSLSKAARVMKISYKSAWDTISDINKTSGSTLVRGAVGGKNGGGSFLTPAAHLYINIYDKIYEGQKQFFDLIEKHMGNYDELMKFLARNSLRTSARNQLHGKIVDLQKEDIMSIVKIDVNGVEFNVLITTKSVEELGLKKDSLAWLIFKTSWVEIINDSKKDENVFEAVVRYVDKENKAAEITLELNNGIVLVSSSNAQYIPAKDDKVKIHVDKSNIIIGV
ncbi:MAG: TOBE domain-containing protein [Campylobacteraceae bacterium]|jgi:molybdate transport system regulatory protein|nr:TOBE domain-containing protein [Campylobacteraceae bacterium]